MGLGKTAQSISFLQQLRSNPKTRVRGPFLIVAPLSTLPHWEREVSTWTDLDVVVYHGSRQSRKLLEQSEFYYRDEHGQEIVSKDLIKLQVLVTSPEMLLVKEQTALAHMPWRCLVVDEAHRLKNTDSRLTQYLLKFHREHTVLLTGTPLQVRCRCGSVGSSVGGTLARGRLGAGP